MTLSLFAAGAIWRKWDLHVHSPASEGFKGEYEDFVIQLGNSTCDVIGINDYFSVAGYKEIRRRLDDPEEAHKGNTAYKEALEKLRAKTLLPVVECRMNNVVLGKKNSGTRINFHIIFSNEVDPDDIETLIKGFKVKDKSVGNQGYQNKKFLLDEVSVDFFKVRETLQNDETFSDKYLLWIPYDEYGGIDGIDPKTDKLFKEGLVKCADILGSSNKKQSDFFLWKSDKFSEEEFRGWFGKRKPCIKGSDSHSTKEEVGCLKDENSQPTDKFCWIKADPTFRGLQQIINEPEDRVFLGVCPPKKEWVNSNKTRFLSSIKIGKVHDSKLDDVWFDCDIPLNHDMIAIIGNKGSGKSALADIIALASDTDKAEYFSFLQKKKFREKKLASNFEAVATWQDGNITSQNLQNDPEPNKPEMVKYIPQSYLETVCTETSVDEQSIFQKELRKVVFSHISPANRLGKETLEELIEYKTEEVNAELRRHRQELSEINGKIITLEQKASADFRQQIEEALKKKSQELEAHVKNKPADVPKPDNLTEEQKQAYTAIEAELNTNNEALQGTETQIETALKDQKSLTEDITLATKMEGKLTNIRSEIDTLKTQNAENFRALGLDIDAVIDVTINNDPLAAKKTELIEKKAKVDESLSAENANSLVNKKKGIHDKIEELKGKLDAPNKRYQEYLRRLKEWEKRKAEIEGAENQADTVKYYEAQLKYIQEILPTAIKVERGNRAEISRKIHGCIAANRNTYAALFAPVQQLIEDTVIIKEGFKLSFDSMIIQRGFVREFFEYHISQGVQGSFCGKDAGEKKLNDIIEDYDFNQSDQSVAFAEKIQDHLEHDKRSKGNNEIAVGSQLKKHATLQKLYDYLWGFDYLLPEYSLKLDGKDLSQLSPGERGALLLVFYLLVDTSNKPIIVDQPEENFDNQTVYHLLIPVIKEVKKRRQIIMVTHNPNIAVVCDAEQVIFSSIDRADNNRITYTSGSIENPETNKHILDILEGTRPAFDNRDAKYYSS
jgi:ABC-type lipoprotein export system ATPase subunit/uncharacterized coiled-coil DUF342 family protein